MSEEKIITENQSANEAEVVTEQTDSLSGSAKTGHGVKENTSEKIDYKKIVKRKWFKRFCIRVFDLIISFIALLFLALPFILISFAIVCDSKGGAFFKQVRVGKNGKEFKIMKYYKQEILDYKPDIIIFCITYRNISHLKNLFEE